MTASVPPIGTQFSRLAELSPDEARGHLRGTHPDPS